MNLIGLCEKNNIRFIGKNHYICEKAKRSYRGDKNQTDICKGCEHALKECNEKENNQKKTKGLCGEENLVFKGNNMYSCQKCGFYDRYTGNNPSVLCIGCGYALEEDKSEKEKEEQPHETITRLCDMVAKLHTELYHAKNDIGALLWLNGNCEYCANGQVEKYCGAERWTCKLGNGIDCKPVWRGIVKESEEE